ncbi:UNVERIFIED_CONTAM: hypothetical protein GTU68_009951, partial [Idotea baltica]|nr:hypothetical protein [Idotea baltica]
LCLLIAPILTLKPQISPLTSSFELVFQLPYYIDGNIKITQSNAILRYIGAKTNTAGKTPEEKVQVSMLECEAYDLRTAFTRLCYDSNFVSFVLLTTMQQAINS